MAETEYWVDIPEGYLIGFHEYEASNYGQIRRKDTGLILSSYPSPKGTGRYVKLLKTDGKYSNRTVARLVYVAFHPDDPWPAGNKLVIRQVNGDPDDFRPQNLALGKSPGRPPGPRRNGYLRDPR